MLILSGGGDPNQVMPIDECFIKAIDALRPVLYIPLAMEDDAENEYQNCANWFGSVYHPLGIEHFDVLIDANQPIDLDQYSAVFIGGGNTFVLLDALRIGGLHHALKNYHKRGGLIYGGSAGAIIFGKTIESAIHADKNHLGLTDLSGLDLLSGCDIWCHYAEEDLKLIQSYQRDLYMLYEESGLIVTDDGVEGIGRPYIRHVPKA